MCVYDDIFLGNPHLEAKVTEQKLIASYDTEEIRDLLVKLSATSTNKPVWRLNSSWELAIPLQSVVMSMPRGFVQDFSYVLLAKSRQLMNINQFDASVELLTILDNEVKNHTSINTNIVYKLCRLISWEVLICQVQQLLVEWPANHLSMYTSTFIHCLSLSLFPCLSACLFVCRSVRLDNND